MPEFVDREAVRALINDGALVLEVLERSQYDETHLPGAEHMPLWEISQAKLDGVDRDRAVVVYCYDNE